MPEKLAEATIALGKQLAKVRDCCAVAWTEGPRPVLVEVAGRCDALFGVPRTGLRDQPAGLIFGGGERAARDVALACKKGASAEQRLMVRVAGPQAGRQFPALLATRALPGGVLALVRDLTAAPPEVDAALRAEDLARFASLVAHEVRNPLSAVKITLQSLERGERLQGNDARRIAIAIREARNIEQLLTDVQEYARPASLSLVPVDPLEVVGRAVEDLAEEWRTRSVDFALEAPKRMPLVQAPREAAGGGAPARQAGRRSGGGGRRRHRAGRPRAPPPPALGAVGARSGPHAARLHPRRRLRAVHAEPGAGQRAVARGGAADRRGARRRGALRGC